MAQWAYAMRWAKHAIGPQAKAQEARPTHKPDEIIREDSQ